MHLEALTKEGSRIFPKLEKFKDFYLAGGTALALQMGHRISVDFDFFSDEEISKSLLPKIKQVFSESNISAIINNLEELTVLVDKVKITFVKYPFPVIYDFVESDGISLLSAKEIASTKAYSIGRRGTFKDYVDLFFILSEGICSLEEIIEISEKKFKGEFNSRIFLEDLVYLKDIEDTQIVFLKKEVGKKEIEQFFEDKIRKLKI